jgi:hypothetical protein
MTESSEILRQQGLALDADQIPDFLDQCIRDKALSGLVRLLNADLVSDDQSRKSDAASLLNRLGLGPVHISF